MILFTNNASTSLASACAAGSAYINVLPGTAELFPVITTTNDYFLVTLVNPNSGQMEIMKVTSVNGDRFNVLRAQEGTTAMAFPQNTIVENRLTAGSLTQLLNDTAATTTTAGRLRLATSAEALAGTNQTVAISPYTLNAVIQQKVDSVLASVQEQLTSIKVNVSYLGYPGEIRDFYEQTAPTGWVIADGRLLTNASTNYTLLYNELRKSGNAWKLKTQAQWDTLHNAVFATTTTGTTFTWNNVGGVPFFVVDTTANTIRVPDLRGMYREPAGFDGLTVGGVHGDTIRNITGKSVATRHGRGGTQASDGCFASSYWGYDGWGSGTSDYGPRGVALVHVFNASSIVPAGNVTKPRSYGVLSCVCTGVTA